jgi:hypothetical protein
MLKERASALKEAIATAEEAVAKEMKEEEEEEEEEEEGEGAREVEAEEVGEEAGSGLRRFHVALQDGWQAGDEVTAKLPGGASVVLRLPECDVTGKTIAFSLPRARARAVTPGIEVAPKPAEDGKAGVDREGVTIEGATTQALPPFEPAWLLAIPPPLQAAATLTSQLPQPLQQSAVAVRQGATGSEDTEREGAVSGVGSGGGLRARVRGAAAAAASRVARRARSAARALRRGQRAES